MVLRNDLQPNVPSHPAKALPPPSTHAMARSSLLKKHEAHLRALSEETRSAVEDERTSLLSRNSAKTRSYHGSNEGDSRPFDTEKEKSNFQLAWTLIPMTIGIFLAAMDHTIVVSAYASIGSEFNELESTSWVATGYMLTLSSIQPLYGKLSDVFGRKSCLLFAYSVFGLGCLLCGLSRNMNELIAARAFQGVGAGGMATVVTIIMSDLVPLRSRGTWQGVVNIVYATGSATGAPLGGILADGIGWRWAFLFQAPITLVAILAVSVSLHLAPKSTSSDDLKLFDKLKRVDGLGALTLIIAVLFLLLALDRGGNVSWTDDVTICFISIFAFSSMLFGLVECKIAKEPFAPKRIIFNRSLIASYLCNVFCTISSIAIIYQAALYFQVVWRWDAGQAGLGLLPGIVGGVMGSLTGGLIVQSTGKYYWLTVSEYSIMFSGALLLALETSGLLPDVMGILEGILIGLSLMALGNGSGITTTLIALIANAEPEDQAIATAVSYLFRSLGSVIGVSVASTLVEDTLRTLLEERLADFKVDVDEVVRNVRASLDYIDQLSPEVQAVVKTSYGEAFPVAFWFAAVCAGAAMVSAAFIKEKAIPERR